ncbi:MAG: InlB B-repeat-containing protein, partial [Bacilli bacterium]|nr:InlB B-repeat-containing protein [Bacilli bacterium]
MKKFFSLVLIFITALVLTACGEKITLTLNEADKTIAIETGGEITVTPTVTEGFELEWTSGDLDIVKVIPGYDTLSAIIQAVGEGSVTVTVKVKDKDVRTTITIVVTDPDPISVTVAGAGNVAIGAQLTLTGSVYPAKANQALTWTTANAEIATVSAAGVVTGVAEGSVKIKATTEIETIFVEVTVNVVKPDPTGVTVSGPTSIIAGENGTYTASVAPVLASPAVVWSTSDASLATITAEGVLTALLPGTIKVRATSAAKGTVYGEIDLTIVHPDPVSITVSGAAEVIALESATYTAAVLPALAVQTVTWSTSDVTKATIDATTGVLTGVAKGTVTVIATSTAKGTIIGEFAVTIGPENSQITMSLDGGYWPITGTDAFVTADPTATATLRFGYNPASAEYYVAGTGSNHFNHLFLQDKDRKISPSVWQNRAFLNRNANGFFEVQVVKLAGSANTNPPLDDYEYTLYAHEGFTAGYNFIASLQVGQIITLNGFDINAQSVFEIGDVVVNVYTAEQATSTANLVAPGETVVTLPIPGKLGASFDGWYATAEFTGEPVLTVNTTATVYAKWSYDLSAVAVKADVAAGAAYYSAQAKEYFVSGKTLFATLEEALAAVEADGTVYLEAGTYDAVANVTKNNITIKGTVDSIVSAAINVAANVEGLTIDGVKFTGVGQVVLALAGGVKNFTFKNNVATDLAIGNGTFISFKNDGTANNENFVIENNQFLIGAATVAPRWIRGGNILGFTVVNNIFEGLAGVYVDGIRIEGTNETNSEGIGLGGIVLIEGNQFNKVGQRGIWVRRISATQIDVTNNVFDQTGGETAGGGLQLEVLVPDTILVVDIYENEFKNITHYFGIRIGTTAVPNIGTVTIKFNKFVSFTLATAYYIQGYDGATTINANSNYFDVAPTAEDMAFVSSYTPVYATLEELATAIAMSKPQTLTYESNGGSAVAPEEVPGGFKATEPEDPTRDGYTFVGWYKETTLTTLFDFAVDTVSVPTTLYAKWTPIEYNVTYNYNEGALVFATQADLFTAFLTDFHAFTQSTDTLAVFMDDAATTTVPFDGTWQSKAGDPADYVYLNKLYSGYRPTGPVAESQYFIENAAYYAKWMPFLDMIQGFVKTVNAGQNFWSPEVSDAPTFVGLIRLPQFIKGVKPIASISDAVMAQVPAYTKAHATYNISKVTTLPVPVKAGFVFAGWYDNAELTGTPMYEIPAGEMGDLTLYAAYVADVASTGTIIVSPEASKLYFGNKVVINGQVFEVGVNYFDNLVDAAAAVVTGDTVVVLPG